MEGGAKNAGVYLSAALDNVTAGSRGMQHYQPAANAPMKSDRVIKMGIVMIGRRRGACGGSGREGAGDACTGTSLSFL